MENKNGQEECLKKIALLSPEQLDAIGWLIENFELAVKICEASNLTQAKREYFMKIAGEDAVLEILLILDKILKSDQSCP